MILQAPAKCFPQQQQRCQVALSKFDAAYKSHFFLQVWHALQRRKPRNKCPILKGCFPSSFESKGRGLPAGLQSSSKAAQHAYLRIGISSSSSVLSVYSCSQPKFWRVMRFIGKSTCRQRHRHSNHTYRESQDIRILCHSAERQ